MKKHAPHRENSTTDSIRIPHAAKRYLKYFPEYCFIRVINIKVFWHFSVKIFQNSAKITFWNSYPKKISNKKIIFLGIFYSKFSILTYVMFLQEMDAIECNWSHALIGSEERWQHHHKIIEREPHSMRIISYIINLHIFNSMYNSFLASISSIWPKTPL